LSAREFLNEFFSASSMGRILRHRRLIHDLREKGALGFALPESLLSRGTRSETRSQPPASVA
jgi:hypothetical protein